MIPSPTGSVRRAAGLGARIAVAVSLIAAAPAPARTAGVGLTGDWRIARVVDYAPVTAITQEEATAIVGRPLTIAAREVRFMDRRCDGAGWTRARVRTAVFLARYRIDRPAGYPASAVVATPRCRPGAGLGPFLLLPRRLSFVWRGALLEAERGGR